MDRFLEKIFRPVAVTHLIRYVVVLTAVVYVLGFGNPHFFSMLVLDRAAVLNGEIWRLVTWVFVVEVGHPIFMLFYLWFLWFLGDLLESHWGMVRLNAYCYTGILATVLAAFLCGVSIDNVFSGLLSCTLLFAAATIAPNYQIMLFAIIPVRLKWIAILAAFYPVVLLVHAPLLVKIAVLLGVFNYFAFFGASVIGDLSALIRRKRFERHARKAFDTLHCCARCGATEVSAPDTDFRIAADGSEYCEKHLPR